jgi:hypothetical protein
MTFFFHTFCFLSHLPNMQIKFVTSSRDVTSSFLVLVIHSLNLVSALKILNFDIAFEINITSCSRFKVNGLHEVLSQNIELFLNSDVCDILLCSSLRPQMPYELNGFLLNSH